MPQGLVLHPFSREDSGIFTKCLLIKPPFPTDFHKTALGRAVSAAGAYAHLRVFDTCHRGLRFGRWFRFWKKSEHVLNMLKHACDCLNMLNMLNMIWTILEQPQNKIWNVKSTTYYQTEKLHVPACSACSERVTIMPCMFIMFQHVQHVFKSCFSILLKKNMPEHAWTCLNMWNMPKHAWTCSPPSTLPFKR